MKDRRIPLFLADLYRDVRDRRLLPVVALLLVALVAVPVALSASSASPPASDPGAEVDSQVEVPETQVAVLAEAEGIRDYRKRLGKLNRRNPFRQKFQVAGLSRTEVEDVSAVAGTAISGGHSPASGDPSTSSSTSGGPAGSGVAGSGSEGKPETETVTKLETFRVDVRFGPTGEVKTVKDVKPLDALDPVAVFVGVSEDGKTGLFFVASKVASVSGDGVCLALGATGCGVLVLEGGEAARLDSSADGESYTLKLSGIKRVLLR